MAAEAVDTELIRVLVECTLAIIKPDAAHKELEIEEIILQSGFLIVQRRKLHLSPELASEFYSQQSGQLSFPSLTAHLCSAPLVALLLARDSAVQRWRDLLGPVDSQRARETHPRSLRAIYGTDKIRNALHGSDCFTAAEREISFIFPNTTIEPFPSRQAAENYLSKYVNPTLLKALTQLCKLKPTNPVVSGAWQRSLPLHGPGRILSACCFLAWVTTKDTRGAFGHH
ncbi:nucleoside diphosphate kinase homolog 5-like [Leucoraja erinacea]|uniref:nucleoside diphosphate kinase homolog 5-like n=1 Tax=Leucoraja erinaceus TaxID=7782 RepID=UPI002456BBDE|nr:nucleoside diphosphate kinase homolog 5-like [Leucoraja erinacea]